MKDYSYKKFLFEFIIICITAFISGLLINLFSENNISWFYKERIWQQGEILSAEQSYSLLKIKTPSHNLNKRTNKRKKIVQFLRKENKNKKRSKAKNQKTFKKQRRFQFLHWHYNWNFNR